MPLDPGRVLNDRYRIVRILGQGGFGAVYYGWDLNLERVVAIKENLYAADEAQRRQFRQEALVLSGLSHPHLPRVLDYFILPDQGQYLVMEYVEGQDLEQMLAQAGGPLPVDQAITWISQICDALTYLHARTPPVIHRDIKPANIRITSTGQALLVDFGIAKTYSPDRHTTTGARAYTTGFSPPEQYGRGRTDAQSDIYSLGATLFTLLTNVTPPDSVDRFTDRSLQNLPPVHHYNPLVSPQISAAVSTAMQIEKSARFHNAADFKTALVGSTKEAHVARMDYATQTTPWASSAPSKQPVAHVWWLGGTLGAGGLVLLGILAVILLAVILPRLRSRDQTGSTIPVQEIPAASEPANSASTAASVTLAAETATPEVVTPGNTRPAVIEPVLATEYPTGTPTLVKVPTASGPGGLIAFHSDRSGNLEIYTIRPDGSELTQITHTNARETYPSWSPNGRLLAYQTNAGTDMEIHVIDVNSGDTFQVTDNQCNDYAPTFSPQGDTIAYYSDCAGSRQVFTARVDGSQVRQLTDKSNAYSWYPFWGYDGRSIYFSSNLTGKYWLYSLELEGDNLTQLVQGCSGVPSPDGALLVFQEYCVDQSSLFIADISGNNVEMIVSGDQFDNRDPYWSPDSNWVVFRSNRNGNFDLFLYNLLTHTAQELTTGPGNDYAPNWSPVEP